MAKNESKGSKAAASDANGSILFEVMPVDFQPPTKAQTGQWDAIVTKLTSADHLKQFKGQFVTLFKSPVDDAEPCNTRAKGVRKAAKKLGLNVVVTVRKLESHNALLAKSGTDTAQTPKA